MPRRQPGGISVQEPASIAVLRAQFNAQDVLPPDYCEYLKNELRDVLSIYSLHNQLIIDQINNIQSLFDYDFVSGNIQAIIPPVISTANNEPIVLDSFSNAFNHINQYEFGQMRYSMSSSPDDQIRYLVTPTDEPIKRPREYKIVFDREKKARDFVKENPHLVNIRVKKITIAPHQNDVYSRRFSQGTYWEVRLFEPMSEEHHGQGIQIMGPHGRAVSYSNVFQCRFTEEEDAMYHDAKVEAAEVQSTLFEIREVPGAGSDTYDSVERMNRSNTEYHIDMLCESCLSPLSSAVSADFDLVQDKIVCKNCFHQATRWCEGCNKRTFKSALYRTTLGNKRCESCIANYEQCESCERYIINDNEARDINNEHYCSHCASHVERDQGMPLTFERNYNHSGNFPLRSYSESLLRSLNSKEFGSIIKSNRKFGVEIECIYPSQVIYHEFAAKTPPALGIGTDGSIQAAGFGEGGIEIRTPRLSGKAGEEFIGPIADYLTKLGFVTNKSCGLHIHLDGGKDFLSSSGRAGDNIKALLLFYTAFEDVIQSFLPRTRRNNKYCRSVRSQYSIQSIVAAKTLDDIEKIWYQTRSKSRVEDFKGSRHDSRYSGANFHTLLAQNHLEIRYHSGTTMSTRILQWINLHCQIMDHIAAGSITIEQLLPATHAVNLVEKTELFFDLVKLSASARKYFLGRQVKFGEKREVQEEELKD